MGPWPDSGLAPPVLCDFPVTTPAGAAPYLYSCSATVSAPPQDCFRPIRRIGGDSGWYFADWLWRLRGLLDWGIGGIGMRRGRRHPDLVRPGDILDCFRVESFEPDRRLLLTTEWKLPGRGWLEFLVEGDHTYSTIRLTARYDPRGLWGRVYWYLTYPVHQILFTGLLRQIAARCLHADSSLQSPVVRLQ